MRHADCNSERGTPKLGRRTTDTRGSMAAEVAVACTARLHMGFLDLNGSLGRQFGSIGLAIDAPRMLLSVRRSDTTRVDGPEQARATRYLNTIVERLDLPSGHSLHIGEMIPAHAGL